MLRYRGRVSGALLDRIDIRVEMPRVPDACLGAAPPASVEDSARVRTRVAEARARQHARTGGPNQRLSQQELDRHCALRSHDADLLASAAARMHLSARSRHRILRVARTIADLDGSEPLRTEHLCEAIQLRTL